MYIADATETIVNFKKSSIKVADEWRRSMFGNKVLIS